MDPATRALLLTILRYRTISARREQRPGELSRLRSLLAERAPGPSRPAFDQRAFRRVPVEIDGYLRIGGMDAACRVTDLSAGGARVEDRAGIGSRLTPGRRGVLHVAPGGSTLRIFLPFEVVHSLPEAGTAGLAFHGAPFVGHQRIAGRCTVAGEISVSSRAAA